MANAQLMEEELQQSVMLSEEDAGFDDDGAVRDAAMADIEVSVNAASAGQRTGEEDYPKAGNGDAQLEDSDIDMESYDDALSTPDERVGPEENPTNDEGATQVDGELESEDNNSHEDDDGTFDLDGGEEDDQEDVAGVRQKRHAKHDSGSSAESDDLAEEDADNDDHQIEAAEEEEAEGVGAVKIRPGETDDEDSDSSSSESSASDFSDRESIAEWDDPAENDEDGDGDDESDAADLPRCIFCKKATRRDLSRATDNSLVCKACGEPAHQQCARDEKALDPRIPASSWKCPDCVPDDDESGSDIDTATANADATAKKEAEEGLSPTSRRASAPQIARDLLPSQRGVSKPDSHSMFNQLVLDEDPMDGSRVLRNKRKSSSAGVEVEGEPAPDPASVKRRRKTRSNTSIQWDAAQEQGSSEGSSSRQRSARALRQKASSNEPPCSIVKKTRGSLTIRMRVNPEELAHILSSKSKSSRKRAGGRRRASQASRRTASRNDTTAAAAAAAVTAAESAVATSFFAPSFSQPFYSFYDKETDEVKGKPYGGILTEEQADTTKTLPTKEDRRRFDEAKQKAEEEWRNRLLKMQAEADVPVKKSKKTSGPVSQIECIEFGGWEIDTWYAAPYPEEYSRNRVLYICEFCLKYMNSDYVAWRHKLKCPAKHPPGDEIYRHGSISFFEVDGRKNPVYCQNLCLLAKLFLGSKTLYYDVEPFLFYVLCEYDDLGYHFVGYFSKEKRASSQNNVSCILTLPIHQRKGYGHLLIDFSYLLTRVEEKSGSPEKPLSDMGLVSYRNYWRLVLCRYLLEHVPEDKNVKKGISIRQISDDTGMTPDDVVSALEALRFLVRDPITHVYAFRVDLPFCRKEVAKWEAKKYVRLNPRALTWTPYIMGRGNATNFELGPALNAIAPREDDEEPKPMEIMVENGVSDVAFEGGIGIVRKPSLEDGHAVLESTEPSDDISLGLLNGKVNGLANGHGGLQPSEHDSHRATTDKETGSVRDENDWQLQYENIPVSRFQVFPPVGRRPGMSRVGSSIARSITLPHAAAVRTPAPSRSRGGRGRRTVGSASTRKPGQKKTTTAKRKTGGTGRGPGRWPKGTKKSDYGNATSGPGLPPAWLEKQRQTASNAADEDKEMRDTVQVQTKAQMGIQADTVSASFEVKSDVIPEGAVQSGASSTVGAKASEGAAVQNMHAYGDGDALGDE
ncbi:hypothetical protein F5Y17DRAFT_418937 [Xylariaceae sp. FL0594]|nr:hypothetical protein F5Y17DRAFT_418937 [Xylariaceae sp. FL0594]